MAADIDFSFEVEENYILHTILYAKPSLSKFWILHKHPEVVVSKICISLYNNYFFYLHATVANNTLFAQKLFFMSKIAKASSCIYFKPHVDVFDFGKQC